MRATRFWVLAWLSAIGSGAVLSCGTDEAMAPSSVLDGAGEGGVQSVPVGNGGQAGDGRSGSQAGGGSSSQGGQGAAGGTSTPTAGAGGEQGLAGAGGGGPPTTDGEQLELCARLSSLVVHADNVGRAYGKAVYADCRLRWVIPLEQEPLIDFKNRLVIWSLDLWGCQGDPVTDLALVYGTPPLSPGDVTLLIDHYMTAAQNELDLSSDEFDELQAALRRLAAPLIVGTSTEPSNPQCMESGGAGGGGGAAGAGSHENAGASATGGAAGVGGGAP